MSFFLYDMNRLSITSKEIDFLTQNPNVGVVFNSSYFKDLKQLSAKIKLVKQTGSLVCLNLDCSQTKVFNVEPHLDIFKTCNFYAASPKETKEYINEVTARIAFNFISKGIDIYISPSLSFANNIFQSTKANENFWQHHTAVFSSWINGLNMHGMSCCVCIAPDINDNDVAINSLNRIKLQISAIVDYKGFPAQYSGTKLETVKQPPSNSNSTDNILALLGGNIRQEAHEAIEL